ncbi:GNAT family N-acetyltransferase [Mycolicibacterium fluoranthenivorans]|uniref:N-acetyltransferase domain-containing protein n=1 Tax=Mycolicibacterium fluoranthenivorans TaxID=258505 RepID=A0A1G4VAH2_9MYCO|nr:hypothetical protein [Mycolicibacterium fluoranthenivorans]SCX03697.1 hypothetical protein SAMN02799620_00628 [Mycolicibacterium fluoranthenivorans]
MRNFAMQMSILTERLSLQLRDEGDAEWNHELLGEHDGGTAESVADVRHRLAEQRSRARETGIGLLTIRRRTDNEPLGYCGLIIGRCSLDEPEIACELLLDKLGFQRHHETVDDRGRPLIYLVRQSPTYQTASDG